MPLNIRDPRAQELARELAEAHGTTMTEAVVRALENEVRKARKKIPLAKQLEAIVKKYAPHKKPGGRMMTKEEIDEMWGH